MNHVAVVGLAVVISLGAAGRLPAQTPAATNPLPDLKKWDLTGTIGWHVHQVAVPGSALQPYNPSPPYDASLYAGIVFGHYWTEHVKSELEVANGGTVDVGYADPYPVATTTPYPPYIYARDHLSQSQVAIAQLYQFFHNAWFHPFVGGGVIVARNVHALDRSAQTIPIYGSGSPSAPPTFIDIPAASATRIEWAARPFLETGFKLYVSYHAFIRADFRVAFRADLQSTNARVGFGVDF